MCEKRLGEESRGNWGNWYSCLHHLRIYEKREKITFADITPEWVQGFRDYLDKRAVAWAHDNRHREKEYPLSRNTKLSYFNKLRACLNQAFDERIIARNPMRGIEGFQAEEGTRMYLTLEELQRLVNTPCEYDGVRRAFLFSCLTGLRRSDILKLTWGDVHQQGEFTRIIFRQKKTKGQEYLDITQQAADLMGDRRKADDPVFTDVFTPDCTNKPYRTGYCVRASTRNIIPLRAAHFRRDDARPRNGHLHREQVAWPPGTLNHTDIRQSARQEQTGSGAAHSEHPPQPQELGLHGNRICAGEHISVARQ